MDTTDHGLALVRELAEATKHMTSGLRNLSQVMRIRGKILHEEGDDAVADQIESISRGVSRITQACRRYVRAAAPPAN